MKLHTTIAAFADAVGGARLAGADVGLVPTMGYLHDGHLSLMRRAASECGVTVASIFVNPLQFAPTEDLSSYPRDLDRDLELCAQAGIDHVFAPTVAEMYPIKNLTTVSVGELSLRMEGASRPTHFAGVTTVVGKLCNITGPCRAYFGEKDFQQLVIIGRMVRDLNFPVTVIGCPIVRESDGLALSSRNVYLSAEERLAAPVLHRALSAGVSAIESGERVAARVQALMASMVNEEPLAELDYAQVVDATELNEVEYLRGDVRLLAAARFGRPRLLDNLGVHVS